MGQNRDAMKKRWAQLSPPQQETIRRQLEAHLKHVDPTQGRTAAYEAVGKILGLHRSTVQDLLAVIDLPEHLLPARKVLRQSIFQRLLQPSPK